MCARASYFYFPISGQFRGLDLREPVTGRCPIHEILIGSFYNNDIAFLPRQPCTPGISPIFSSLVVVTSDLVSVIILSGSQFDACFCSFFFFLQPLSFFYSPFLISKAGFYV